MADVIHVNWHKCAGRVKPMHCVNNAPLWGTDETLWDTLKDAEIPYSRLHDTGGAYGGGRYVDIPNIFRNFSADPSDPASYDFAFTDWLFLPTGFYKTCRKGACSLFTGWALP